ncbi:MAG: TonB-dependent receptor [Bacteroidota bacterium]
MGQTGTRILFLMLLSLIVSSLNVNANGALALSNEFLQQQDNEIKVTGTVKDESGVAIPGATVYIQETGNGTITDIDGKYTIEVEMGHTITFSFVGYKTQNVVFEGQSTLDIVLVEDTQALEEIIVVGYGTQKKSDITGSVSVIDMESLPVKSPVSISQALQGAAAGVQVINSGAPGSSPIIRIRGLSTFGGGSPLYVIDGVPGVANRDFNPQEVESIQVLKDASAAAIYGSRAANGVILITTKKGKEKFAIDFDARYGVEEVPRKIDVMNALEHATLDNLAHDNAGIAHSPASDMVVTDPSSMPDTDWQGYMFQPGIIQDYNMSISSANEGGTYRFALGHLNREGVIRGPEFSRSSISLSATQKYEKFEMGTIVRGTYTESNDVIGLPFFDALTALPNVAIYNENNVGGFGAGDDINQTYFTNPVGNQLTRDFRAHTYKAVAQVFAEYKITDELKYKFTGAIDASNQRWIGKREAAYLRYKDNPISSIDESTTHWLDWTFNHILTFDKTIDNHNINAVGVYEFLGWRMRHSRAYGEDVSQDGNGNYFWVVDAAKENQTINGSAQETGLHSAISRINYSYNDKYLVQLTGRYDYTSKLLKENRGAFFPSVSLGWKLTEESFLSDVSFLDLLKLRVGYGELGNANIGSYDYAAFINSNVNYVFGASQAIANGATQIRLVNTDLIWETTATANIGIDFGMLSGRMQGSLEAYRKDTRDALLPVNIPISTGNFGGDPYQNVGDLRNTGVELSVTYQDEILNDLNYRATLNVGANKNEVMNVGDLGQLSGNLTMTRPGYAVGTFFLRETDGIWQLGEEPDAILQGAYPGDVHFIDQNDDGSIDDDDRIMMGNPFPLADIGVNLFVEYMGFDLSIFLFSQLGHDIFWGQGYVMDRTDDYINHLADFEPWTPENQSNTTPIAMYGAAGGRNYYNSQDRYLYNGDFLKIKNLELGYTLPEDLTQKVGMKTLRVYFSGQNLLTLTKYPGYDPEVVNGWILERGVDWGAYPNPRVVSLGLKAKF